MPQTTGHGCQLHFNTTGPGGKGGRYLFLDSAPKIVYPYPEIFLFGGSPMKKQFRALSLCLTLALCVFFLQYGGFSNIFL